MSRGAANARKAGPHRRASRFSNRRLTGSDRSGTGPAYKLRYGLGRTTTVENVKPDPLVTPVVYANRQANARSFKQILLTRPGLKNEIVIAIRQHAGPFPVYAIRRDNVLVCYDIVGNQMQPNGKTISANGVLS